MEVLSNEERINLKLLILQTHPSFTEISIPNIIKEYSIAQRACILDNLFEILNMEERCFFQNVFFFMKTVREIATHSYHDTKQ